MITICDCACDVWNLEGSILHRRGADVLTDHSCCQYNYVTVKDVRFKKSTDKLKVGNLHYDPPPHIQNRSLECFFNVNSHL